MLPTMRDKQVCFLKKKASAKHKGLSALSNIKFVISLPKKVWTGVLAQYVSVLCIKMKNRYELKIDIYPGRPILIAYYWIK